jgi:uncharacterized membrane-anchored protein YitT (DUF2179 family)
LKAVQEYIKTAIPIMLGAAVYAFGLHYFIIPNELMEGGLTGIALLLNYSMGLPPSWTTLIMNVPLFILGWKMFGGRGMVLTVLGTVSLSFFLWIMELLIHRGWIEPLRSNNDYILAALYAGVTIGTGLGIVFRFGGTTGGADIIARLAYKKKGLSMGRVILWFDAAVIGLSLFYIPKEKVLYTLVTVFIASRIIDFINEGAYAAKAFTIVTHVPDRIADTITQEMDRGVTLFQARGAYSKQQAEVVYCVVYRQEERRLKSLVQAIDPRAFIIISDVHNVLGEGFRTEGESI